MNQLPDDLFRDLAVMRRHAMSALSIIERIFKAADPVCRKCFYDQGLIADCRCKHTEYRLTIRP